MVGPAGHLAVGVLNLGRGGGVHRSGVRLIFRRDLRQAFVGTHNLVDHVAARGGIVAGQREGLTQGVVSRLQAADGTVNAGAKRSRLVGGQTTEHVVSVVMHGAVAVGGRDKFAQCVLADRLFFAGTGRAGRFVRMARFRKNVVGIERAAHGGSSGVDVGSCLESAGRQDGLHCEHIAQTVVGVFDGAVGGGRRCAGGVGVDGSGDTARQIVVGFGHHASRVGNGFRPPGGVIAVAVDQNGVRAGGRGAGPGVGRAAVGADVDRVGDAVGLVVIQGLIADAGLVACSGRAEDTGIARAVVVEPVAVDDEDQITGGVVRELLLVQNNIARDIVGVGPGGVAAAVVEVASGEAAGTVDGRFGDQATWGCGLDGVAATVVPGVGGEGVGRKSTRALVDRVLGLLIYAALGVVGVLDVGLTQR